MQQRSTEVLAKTALVGEIDAFLSHSWHDEPELKWAALQEQTAFLGQPVLVDALGFGSTRS